ncbi:MAG: hypothetical protein HC796_06840 [Synechococcaceae cyanobacterium RL_1_2]|nr:hypothetical protein [Synechococcaceae cyanobacterium RL_1_2]
MGLEELDLNTPSAAFDPSMNFEEGEPEEEVSDLLLADSLEDESLFGEEDSELSLAALEIELNSSGTEELNGELNLEDDGFTSDGVESRDSEDGENLGIQLDLLEEDPLLDLGDGPIEDNAPIADLEDFPGAESEDELFLDEDFDGSEEDNWVDQPLELDDSIAPSSIVENDDESFDFPEGTAAEDLAPEIPDVDAIQEVTINPQTAERMGG